MVGPMNCIVHLACKKWGWGGGHWLVRMEWRPDGWSVSAAVNLPLHHNVQKFSAGTGSPRCSRKKGCKMVVVVSTCLSCEDMARQSCAMVRRFKFFASCISSDPHAACFRPAS